MRIRKSIGTKEMMFRRKQSDKGSASMSQNYKKEQKKITETKLRPLLLHTVTGEIERSTHTLLDLIIPTSEDKIDRFCRKLEPSTEKKVFHDTTGFKVTPFEIYHGRKQRIEFFKLIEDDKSYLNGTAKLNNSTTPKKIPYYVGRKAKKIVTAHIATASKINTLLLGSKITTEEAVDVG